jgi:signal transduction histidine kinase
LLSGDNPVWMLGKTGGDRLSRELSLPAPLSGLRFTLALWSVGSPVMIWFTGLFIVVTLFSLTLACRSAYRISGQLTSSLVSLEAAASEIADSGTPHGEVASDGTDEVGRLALSFNSMVRRLKESYAILEGKVEERTSELAKLNRELESIVADRTRELERSNSDLAGFCYAISHELRAPVARLQGFSEALKDKGESEDNRQFCIERVEVASRQLQTVIDAILLLSRLSRVEMSMAEIDFSGLAGEVVTDLQAQGEGIGAYVTIQKGIYCRGDRNLLRVCLANLIGNAFKYSSREETPHVEIGLTDDGDKHCYHVRDNGAGFDMQYIDKLFVPFQRLHQQEEFPGTGIGLATVHRIVERHNGRVWGEGNEGVGATFFFTLGEG